MRSSPVLGRLTCSYVPCEQAPHLQEGLAASRVQGPLSRTKVSHKAQGSGRALACSPDALAPPTASSSGLAHALFIAGRSGEKAEPPPRPPSRDPTQ